MFDLRWSVFSRSVHGAFFFLESEIYLLSFSTDCKPGESAVSLPLRAHCGEEDPTLEG